MLVPPEVIGTLEKEVGRAVVKLQLSPTSVGEVLQRGVSQVER